VNLRSAAVLATAGALAAPAVAQAHVTVQPASAPAGAETELTVRVPNESDTASTRKIAVQLPPGFVDASNEPRPGWRAKVVTRKLATPVKTDDGTIDEEISQVVWTGDGSAEGRIGPGQFADFPLSVLVPDKPGRSLAFKAVQTYSDGKVVRWIGPPDSETPAPQLAVTTATQGGGAADAGSPTAAKPASTTKSDESGPSTGLVVVALVLGALGLLTAIGSLVAIARMRRRGPTQPGVDGPVTPQKTSQEVA
jgi:uncharacterized protein YcnI